MTRTATGVLLTLAGAALSGCVSVGETARGPAEPTGRASLAVPGALTASTTPLPSPHTRRTAHSQSPREDPPSPGPAPPPPPPASPRAGRTTPPPPSPHRTAPREERHEAGPPAAPGGGDVCALGRVYGGWPADSPQALICHATYG
jgi:hypothetical protein